MKNNTKSHHFALAYSGKLGYRLYSQRDKNRLYMATPTRFLFSIISDKNIFRQKSPSCWLGPSMTELNLGAITWV